MRHVGAAPAALERRARALRWKAAAFMALASTACYGWTGVEVAPKVEGRPLQSHGSNKVRVALTDGRKLFFSVATLKGDSLIGLTNDGPDGRYAIPTSSIKEVATYNFKTGETVALVAVATIGFLGLVSACAAALGGA